ncbi:hypothetical protein [Evansella cellulosilytica]|uniref:Transporter n=1 Tax=Evansella cellulosilytica (strain ATCC 21833 / DSM 2522 / FERM P-1141 / JCM 9156 / N-4) TaxID=649639 RepID=E6U124_EVAC2|nr:hypothetical protein [Evansella cellulosilytica]ADU30336.1 hypothetical protein Bcell_2074 [Evansella cellulosilytica DSM 2522]
MVYPNHQNEMEIDNRQSYHDQVNNGMWEGTYDQRQFQPIGLGPIVGGLSGIFGLPGGRPPFGPPSADPGLPPSGPVFGPPLGFGPGQPPQGGPPSSPPPSFIPSSQQQGGFGEIGVMAVDPGGIRRCLYRYTYIWLNNRQQFWFYPVFVGRNSIAGYRWTGFFWSYFGVDLRQIASFQCY